MKQRENLTYKPVTTIRIIMTPGKSLYSAPDVFVRQWREAWNKPPPLQDNARVQ